MDALPGDERSVAGRKEDVGRSELGGLADAALRHRWFKTQRVSSCIVSTSKRGQVCETYDWGWLGVPLTHGLLVHSRRLERSPGRSEGDESVRRERSDEWASESRDRRTRRGRGRRR